MGWISSGSSYTGISFDHVNRRKDIRFEAWQWYLAPHLHQHRLLLASFNRSNHCTGHQWRQLSRVGRQYSRVSPPCAWHCVCAGWFWSWIPSQIYHPASALDCKLPPLNGFNRWPLAVQEAERKIPINYASRYSFQSKGLGKAAYLPFKVGGYFFTFLYVLSELMEKLKTLSSFLSVCNQVQNSLGWRCRLTAQV